ncbi:hypothetical protein GLOIN_2v1662919 [Rhizophagus irregularis DAOM 181602=DAOM 197198]|uniref:Uncharacterized protein n=1 Tax=Rhizophagus irregularis (strain DAOM 181602 / DAOM 197198 / MUCL 43194) TaxID=747089 RepID=A0A2P4PK45_RHIID|nr:hypothetical protein GLOIN_2v1662919 [Rhizophagus irregularis DAOM 181602=DAOM 197198]POG65763.1 hypothetical protein GLOIN_2v1662919 [Rhizophagus irregularis DAOM 181602=DAOM 197198]GET66145.1 hypothetical protein GLOIN_2v1662919 [Rhizophagus irregularis DAOM 181602=DAOM 197198]|eukprot:XP_025172629.1 hypothetical protein GLOIN_2v1662919 [Rhizophagus irregularis DAOM 181602=DAOM 197198]
MQIKTQLNKSPTSLIELDLSPGSTFQESDDLKNKIERNQPKKRRNVTTFLININSLYLIYTESLGLQEATFL